MPKLLLQSSSRRLDDVPENVSDLIPVADPLIKIWLFEVLHRVLIVRGSPTQETILRAQSIRGP